MLTLERIEQLRHTTGMHQSRQRYTDEEMAELLDAAEAWNLVETERRRWYRFVGATDIRWIWVNGQVSWTRAKTGHETPQAAVLAALGKKGDPDAPKD